MANETTQHPIPGISIQRFDPIKRGWLILGEAEGHPGNGTGQRALDWFKVRCLTCHREALRQPIHLYPCRTCHPPSDRQVREEKRMEAEATARLAENGWHPVAPFPRSTKAGWDMECVHCGHTKRQQTLPAKIKPCTRPHSALLLGEAEEDVVEADDILVPHLLLLDWAPVSFPGTTTRPWLMRCTRCRREEEVVLDGGLPKPCTHPRETPVTDAEWQHRAEAQRRSRRLACEMLARFGGWEILEAGGGVREKWLLRCAECGRRARRRPNQIETPCSHLPLPDEGKARERIDPLWEVLDLPVDRGKGAQELLWVLRCRDCGHTIRRDPHTRKVPKCQHPAAGRGE
ncbi:hypothetical protein [Streptomyces sp. NPDC001054]